MTDYRCEIPYCRSPPWLRVNGRDLCEKHWSEMCARDHEEHKKVKT